ncbi:MULTISPECIES: hypothetical protein [Salmonella]|uniref:Uncharacterized protein n=1 Tax=Salmonella abortus-equi TaxID=607 RepID=Q3V5M6_SALAE|nr:hypothetical protein [Salmonella enterica]EAN1100684.1 hypothetical protein [Salmonella enterica subsp. enterica serovar Hadar]EBX1109232.1 hypothetical protein [Salmonella enterica subsp. enterica serovar Salford]ECK7392035.1 hypothetical protein [Salmonella enterica subsp. enterica serovar Meleagridis]EEM8339827.1 hypothetical protein [Salmonella enterica subsp. enterica serovar Amager]MZI60823.1 hypothetical protein [Salmonella sp. XN2]HAU7019055.1 hypothetical protein [Salmonella enter
MAKVQLHFDGDIATNHQVSLRTLAKSFTHLQNSLDRAYLEMHEGQLRKYARMQQSYYDDVELLVQEPKEGGYVIDFLTQNKVTQKVIDRVMTAIDGAVDDAKNNAKNNAEVVEKSVETRKAQLASGVLKEINYQQLLAAPDKQQVRKYGDRAIVREVDQILSLIRASHAGDSTLELYFEGTKTAKYEFDKAKATAFHKVVAQKNLGDPVAFKVIISKMDRYNNSAKIINVENKSIANLYFTNPADFQGAVPFFEYQTEMEFIGCPYIEYGAFDPMSGDVYFIRLL